jgi:hypothetical protein
MYLPVYNPKVNHGKYNYKKVKYDPSELKEVLGCQLFIENRRLYFQPGEAITVEYEIQPLSVWELLGDKDAWIVKTEVKSLMFQLLKDVEAKVQQQLEFYQWQQDQKHYQFFYPENPIIDLCSPSVCIN